MQHPATPSLGLDTLDLDTALMPEIIADSVCREVASYLDDESLLNDEHALADTLAAKARAIYSANARFAKTLRASDGRDTLYAFMRHWLTAELRRVRPAIRLPASFANGLPLPLRDSPAPGSGRRRRGQVPAA